LLREFETDGRVVICDLEAGVGTLLRLQPGQTDFVLIVVNPMAKSIDVARRALEIADGLAEVVLVANRVRDPEDVQAIARALGREPDLVVPEDSVIADADRDGEAPIDADAGTPGVVAIEALAGRLAPAA
jgi:CO dehydrogenase nickel-insertion accessory protein CooC1